MKRIGIDMGSSSIHIVLLEENKLIDQWTAKHYGKSYETVLRGLQSLNLTGKYSLCFTGANASSLHKAGFDRCEDIPAIIEGAKFLTSKCGSIIEIGSQNARFITDIEKGAPQFATNEHCAGGTGSFFEDQMSRLGLKIEDYSDLVKKANKIPNISGRCAVFAKTDIIHRQQEGICKEDILKGLCYAMIRNYKATIIRSLPIEKPVVLLGGVSKNDGVKMAIVSTLKLEENELLVPENGEYAGAVGAAILSNQEVEIENLKEVLKKGEEDLNGASHLPKLVLNPGTVLKDPDCSKTVLGSGAYLGVDVGSTSTNLVLLGFDGTLIDYLYLRTSGNPEGVVRQGMHTIQSRYPNVHIRGVGITGSGRERLGKMMGADVIKDEITAQAKAAATFFPNVDTVFEIGGQDSKYISIKNGNVVDFQMNKICAAGTGSFIEEQAARMNIPIEDFGPLALSAEHPSQLGERCTVFIGTTIAQKEAQGASDEEIAAGLCHSIVKNYLHKVVGNHKVGEHIVLQGGVDYNPGIVAAFQSAYGNRIHVSPVFSISGAYGVALLAKEIVGEKASSFLGFDFARQENASFYMSNEVKRNLEFYRKSGLLIYEDYDGRIDPRKKTIGVPLVLVIVKFFPMINAFFKNLGYNVILSKPTNDETIALAQQYASGENCYPVKLIYGHMMQLAQKKVDYIFLPSIHTIMHPHASAKHSYGCPYMQIAARMVYDNLHLKEQGIELLSPVLDLELGAQYMAMAMLGAGKKLGFSKPRCMPGLLKGAAAVKKMSEDTEAQGKALIDALKPNEKVLVIISRAYGIVDPVLNMGIPEILLKKGYKVITSEHLPGLSVDLQGEYPHMYWPFGDHLLSSAKIIAHHPNLFAVYLTNHGCGPDTLMGHMIKEEMQDKPYLQIEVDEHFSPVGVITRIEAFLNSLENQTIKEKEKGFELLDVAHKKPNILEHPDRNRKLYIPDLDEYSRFFKEYFETQGYVTDILSFDEEAMALGRAEMSTKEYLPFVSITGAVLKEIKKDRNIQILIPFDYGADAEGQYARAIRAILDRNGYTDVPVVGPMLEELPDTALNFDLLTRTLLTGDLVYCLPKNERQNIQHILSEQELLDLAKTVKEDPKKIAIVGTPMSITSLDDGVLDKLEDNDYPLMRMPFAEMMMFLWKDNDKKIEESFINKISEALGQASNFAKDLDTLIALANQKLYSFNGNEGRYRLAKTVQLSQKCKSVINMAPRYENTQMILTMEKNEMDVKAPVYDVLVDDDFDENAWARLRSFLYYAAK